MLFFRYCLSMRKGCFEPTLPIPAARGGDRLTAEIKPLAESEKYKRKRVRH